ncbi:MAG TPA: MDR family MFS transporter [Acidimicrobiales bacterium]|nr:MDR family MFS transporter [Acidimicrobiales bacterium]
MLAPEAGPVAALELTRRRIYIIVGALLLGMFIAALDQTIVSTALPTIVSDLGGASHLSWVVTSYLLASTVSTPLWGKLGDLYGRKIFFQAAIVIFLIGSVLAGISQNMTELIVFRAIQGLGGGGLMIGSQAIVGDVVSPRERGRYMGLFGAMFGLTTVIGPLLGGLLTEKLSWRWVFYINIPIGILALFATAAALPGTLTRVKRVIDYLGTTLLAVSATSLVLLTSLGGTSYAWGSPQIIGLGVIGVVTAVLFVFAERRAVEPVLPISVLTNRVFASASAIGFVVGFAMFGALTFMPLFLQDVKGVSLIDSGVRILPIMAGLFACSIGSGQIVTRTGRYKVFPVVGTGVMTLGLWLLSQVGVATNAWIFSLYMFVFGAGIGLVMQILVVAVQNAAPYEQLGVATSGTTFFRQIGGCFGTALFGALFANMLLTNLESSLHGKLPKHVNASSLNPAAIKALPPAVRLPVITAIAHTVNTIFLVAVPIGLVAFALSWFLPEIELRRTVRDAVGPEQAVPMHQDATSLQTVQRALEQVARRENRAQVYVTLAERAHLDLQPASCWLLYRLREHPEVSLVDLSGQLKVDPSRLEAGLGELETKGYVTEEDGTGRLHVTTSGEQVTARLTAARQQGLADLLEGLDPEEHPELMLLVQQLAHELLADDKKLLADARPRATA